MHVQGEMPARRLAESVFDALAVGAAGETEEGSGEVAGRPWGTARPRQRSTEIVKVAPEVQILVAAAAAD